MYETFYFISIFFLFFHFLKKKIKVGEKKQSFAHRSYVGQRLTDVLTFVQPSGTWRLPAVTGAEAASLRALAARP